MSFNRALVIFTAVMVLLVGAEYALADCTTTGFQQHVVVWGAMPAPVGNVTLTGQWLRTPETKGDCSFVTLGWKNSAALLGTGTSLSVEPMLGHVGGWYASSDGVMVGSKLGLKRGHFAINLDFEWFTDTQAGYQTHTKFWAHNASYAVGRFAFGGIFQKVDKLEKVAPFVNFNLPGSRWTFEGRWYQSLNVDAKYGCRTNNGRAVVKCGPASKPSV
jgi:hypothetical protein